MLLKWPPIMLQCILQCLTLTGGTKMMEPIIIDDQETKPIKLRPVSFFPAASFNVTNNLGESIQIIVEGREIKIQKGT